MGVLDETLVTVPAGAVWPASRQPKGEALACDRQRIVDVGGEGLSCRGRGISRSIWAGREPDEEGSERCSDTA